MNPDKLDTAVTITDEMVERQFQAVRPYLTAIVNFDEVRRALAASLPSTPILDEDTWGEDGDQSGTHAGYRHKDNRRAASLPSTGAPPIIRTELSDETKAHLKELSDAARASAVSLARNPPIVGATAPLAVDQAMREALGRIASNGFGHPVRNLDPKRDKEMLAMMDYARAALKQEGSK